MIVVSSAIKKNNTELIASKKLKNYLFLKEVKCWLILWH